jgi:hypothetical protein
MKVGRNDPCPCGSGRKYKHCCGGGNQGRVVDATALFQARRMASEMQAGFQEYEADPRHETMTYQETKGSPNAATELIKEFKVAMGGRRFSSMAELQAAFEQFQDEAQNRGLDDFLGISPNQMHLILYSDPREAEAFLAVGEGLNRDHVKDIPLLRRCVFLLERLKTEGNLLLTESGYLNTAFLSEWYEHGPLQEDLEQVPHKAPRSESASPVLGMARYVCEDAGLVGHSGRCLALSKRGHGFLAPDRVGDLYRELFYSYLRGLADPDSPGADTRSGSELRLVVFFCRFLSALDQDEFTHGELIAAVQRAFPQWGDNTMYYDFLARYECIIPGEELGLIRRNPSRPLDRPVEAERHFRSPFYREMIRWK